MGAYGNFALAAHRTTFGAPFGDIGELRIGDQIYVEVPELETRSRDILVCGDDSYLRFDIN
jgi:sortase (surface protein transpeptidase)